jgi:hypothetical protein
MYDNCCEIVRDCFRLGRYQRGLAKIEAQIMNGSGILMETLRIILPFVGIAKLAR